MTVLAANNADAQPAGTAVAAGGANTGGAGNTAFNEAVTGANIAHTFQATGFRLALNSTATAITYVGWTSAVLGAPQSRLRGAVYFTVHNAIASSIRWIGFYNGATLVGRLGITNGLSGFQFRNAADAAQGTTGPALTADTRYRVEFDCDFTAGTALARLYVGNSTTQTGADQSASFAWGATSVDHVRFGFDTANFSSTAGQYLEQGPMMLTTDPLPIGPGPYSVAVDDGTGDLAANTAGNIRIGDKFRIRQELQEAGGVATSTGALELWVSKNGGAYAQIVTGSGDVRAVTSAGFADGDATTDLLTGATGTFVAGAGDTNAAIPAVSLGAGGQTEVEWSLQLMSTGPAIGDTYTFEARRTGGAALDSYTRRPAVTAIAAAAAGGAALTVNIDDVLTVADSTSAAVSTALADTLTVADAVGRDVTHPLADTLNVADATSSAPAVGVADTLGVADTATPATGKGAAIADVLGIADATALDVVHALADTLAVADAVTRDITHPLADALNVADATSSAPSVAVADSLGVFDAFSAYYGLVRAAGPRGYWRLGEAVTTDPARDSSPNGLDGAYVGAVVLGIAGPLAGDPDTAAGSFTAGRRVDLPAGAIVGTGAQWTIEAWLNPTGVSATALAYAEAALGNVIPAVAIGTGAGRPLLFYRDSVGSANIQPAGLINDGAWHHVAAVLDSGNALRLYVDGVEVGASTPPGGTLALDTATIAARRTTTTTNVYTGAIDELAVYPVALAPAEIAAHAAAARSGVESGKGAAIADTLTVADAVITEGGKGAAIADTLTVADAVTRDVGHPVADALTVADATTVAPTVGIADTLAVADTVTAGLAYAVALNDAATVADSIATATGKGAAIADALTVADAVTVAPTVGIADSIAVVDAMSAAVALAIVDALAVADQASPAVARVLVIPDTLGIADTLTTLRARVLFVDDVLGLTDTIDATLTLSRYKPGPPGHRAGTPGVTGIALVGRRGGPPGHIDLNP